MERLFGRKGSSSDLFDGKGKKKPFFNSTRHHYKPFHATSTPYNTSSVWPKRLLSPTRAIITLITVIFFFFFLYPAKNEHLNRQERVTLKDQPLYKRHESACSATLCNPTNKCSTWKPNQEYTWSELSQAGVFRDLSTIQLTAGCQLRIKVEGRVDNGEWLSIPTGKTECNETGYGTKCRNFVEMDLKTDILVMAYQLRQIMKEKTGQGKEITLVQHAKESSKGNHNLDATLISQFSVNRLDTFAKAMAVWQGPISIAIYLTQPSDIDELIQYFENEKNLEIYSRATIALVKPNYLSNARLAYPINHLRNIAITESTTDYIFVLDADFIPSANLYNYIRLRLIPFILYQSGNITPTAWVVPCFAIREAYNEMPVPETYEELRKLVGDGVAYITDPGAGHGPTLATEVAIVRPLLMGNPLAYEVCFESQWEPYYVLHRSAPLYDARFKNQGGDKQSHALQLNAERYRFMVLREVFMVHKDHSTMVWPGGGFEQSQKAATNWNYFEDYMHEIESIYGSTARWPRGCSSTAIGWQDQRRDTVGLAAGSV